MNAAGTARQFATFLSVGGLAALANFSSRFLFAAFVGFEVSVLLAFLVGLSTAFALNRRFVFSGARSTTWRIEATRFLVVNLLGLAVTMGVAIAAHRVLVAAGEPTPWAEGGAHLVGLGCTAVTSYVAHRFWTFAG